MNLPHIELGGPAAARRQPDGGALSSARAREVAEEFESLLIHQMLRQMRQATEWSGDDDELFGAKLFEAIDVELARQLAGDGGLGLADILMPILGGSPIEAVDPHPRGTWPSLDLARDPSNPLRAPVAVVADPPRAPVAVVAEPLLAPPTVVAAPLSGRIPAALGRPHRALAAVPARATTVAADAAAHDVTAAPAATRTSALTSPFGWRQDPLVGGARFHAGVDLKAAYGHEVAAVGPGTVVHAGPQGGYGLTVVIEHAPGVETRYAHLSSLLVAAGESAAAGQIIGRVGATGRATGPHLHFELSYDGRQVDPVSEEGDLGILLKRLHLAADLAGDRRNLDRSGAGEDRYDHED